MSTTVKKKTTKRVASKKIAPRKPKPVPVVSNTLEDKVKDLTDQKVNILNEITKEDRVLQLKLSKLNKQVEGLNAEIDVVANRIQELSDLKYSLV
jgi:peptidoglycan hydrolase CwlO-like protein